MIEYDDIFLHPGFEIRPGQRATRLSASRGQNPSESGWTLRYDPETLLFLASKPGGGGQPDYACDIPRENVMRAVRKPSAKDKK